MTEDYPTGSGKSIRQARSRSFFIRTGNPYESPSVAEDMASRKHAFPRRGAVNRESSKCHGAGPFPSTPKADFRVLSLLRTCHWGTSGFVNIHVCTALIPLHDTPGSGRIRTGRLHGRVAWPPQKSTADSPQGRQDHIRGICGHLPKRNPLKIIRRDIRHLHPQFKKS